jgi:hypothetical protein
MPVVAVALVTLPMAQAAQAVAAQVITAEQELLDLQIPVAVQVEAT